MYTAIQSVYRPGSPPPGNYSPAPETIVASASTYNALSITAPGSSSATAGFGGVTFTATTTVTPAGYSPVPSFVTTYTGVTTASYAFELSATAPLSYVTLVSSMSSPPTGSPANIPTSNLAMAYSSAVARSEAPSISHVYSHVTPYMPIATGPVNSSAYAAASSDAAVASTSAAAVSYSAVPSDVYSHGTPSLPMATSSAVPASSQGEDEVCEEDKRGRRNGGKPWDHGHRH